MASINRVVIIYGAEQRLGVAVADALEGMDVCVSQRSSDFFTKDVAKSIHRDIRQKNPAVVINCLLDPDSGHYPYNSAERFITPSHAMVQQCRLIGARFIHCSSARVYGQQESLADNESYSEYDPWLAFGDDQWRAVLQSLEASLWQQISPLSLQARAETHPNFEYYCLRFGHLLDGRAITTEGALDAFSLDHCIKAAAKGQRTFKCGRTTQKISPIDTKSAAAAIAELCGKRPRPVSGTYNIASTDAVTVAELFNHLAMVTGNGLCVGSMCSSSPGAMEIYGVDADQSLDASFWLERAKTKLPSWSEAVGRVLSKVKPSA